MPRFRAVVLLLMVLTPLSAQWINPYTGTNWNNPGSSLIDTMLRGKMMENVLRQKYGKPAESVATTRFQSGPRLLVNDFADGLGQSQAERDGLREAFEQSLTEFDQFADAAGWGHDLAAAMAYFVGVHYSVYRDGAPVEDLALERMVDQFRAALDTAALRGASDRDKQQLHELFVILATFTGALYQQTAEEGDPASLAAVRELGGEGLRYLLQLDPRRVLVHDGGLYLAAAVPPELHYTDPPGHEVSEGSSYRGFTQVVGQRFHQIAVYQPVVGTGDLATDFETEAQQILLAHAEPDGDLTFADGTTARGYPWRSGTVAVVDSEGLRYQSRLYVVTIAPETVVSVLANATDAPALTAADPIARQLLDSFATP